MKILVLTPGTILDENEGSATHVRELAANLSKLGNEVTVIATLKNPVSGSNVTVKSIKFIRVRALQKVFSLIWGLLLGIATIIRWKPDLIYKRDNLLCSEYLLARLFAYPNITESNEFRPEVLSMLRSRDPLIRITSSLFIWLDRRSMRYSDHIIAVAPKLKMRLHSEYGIELDNITVVSNGANTDLFEPINGGHAREHLQLPSGYRYICFVGTLYPWQGMEKAIRSMPLVLDICPDARLLIIGDGAVKRELEMLAEQMGIGNAVIFTGNVDYNLVPLHINAADICVSPKVPMEGGYSTLKLREYMACAKPVVATRTEDFEILEEQNAGLLVNPEDSREFASAIIKLFQNQELRKQMGENGRRYILRNLSWESVARRVAQVCETVVNKRALQ